MENINIIKRKRKTISLQIKPDGSIELKVPAQMTNAQIQEFLNQKFDWIEKHLYVVVHKLCHRKEMNHSPQFWAEVRKVLPDYEQQKIWLKEHGDEIMMRMLGEIV